MVWGNFAFRGARLSADTDLGTRKTGGKGAGGGEGGGLRPGLPPAPSAATSLTYSIEL
jgi:hypothetical protein